MQVYKAIGLMSGTSLDGLDIAACQFTMDNGKWAYKILHSHTYRYPAEWKAKLSSLPQSDALTFSKVHVEYGHYIGELTRSFLTFTGFMPDLIASHGHTVFHQPDIGLTVQVGAGSAIAAETSLPVVCDFRSMDIALKGQGAPLVPLGDRLLFSEFDACLNLGGFANISFEKNDERIAFDICPVNIILNRTVSRLGLEYDHDGQIARSGDIDTILLDQLNDLEYYRQRYPKSLGREWLEKELLPLCENYKGPVKNLLRTLCEHAAFQVNRAVSPEKPLNILVTGGGAHNKFLLDCIRQYGKHEWTITNVELSDFKEALVFAFLGVLRWRGEINVLSSVTGCIKDHMGGTIYFSS